MQESPLLETPKPPPPPGTSLAARLLNVFASPGEVFEEVKQSPHKFSNWLVPALIMGLIGALAAFITLSQPAIMQKVREQQQQALDRQVASGKMTRAQADQAMEQIERYGPTMVKAAGAVGAVFMGFISIFWWALVLWLLGHFALRANLPFLKLAEVSGLAAAIGILEIVIKMLLVISFSNPLASPSLGMLITHPDPKDKIFMLLNLVNVMTFWALAVRAIGLGRLAGVPFARAARWVFAVWLVMMAVAFGLGSLAPK